MQTSDVGCERVSANVSVSGPYSDAIPVSDSENWTEQNDYRTDGWGELSELEFLVAIVTALAGIFTTDGILRQSFFAGSVLTQKVATGRNRPKALTGGVPRRGSRAGFLTSAHSKNVADTYSADEEENPSM